MFLKTLSFQDKRTGWTLPNLSLERFNLLVGASGVGKTRILQAIWTIFRIAESGQVPPEITFTIIYEHEGRTYTWEFESITEPSPQAESEPQGLLVRERLVDSVEGVLVKREREHFFFRGQALPQLSQAESSLKLLTEADVKLARSAFVNHVLGDRQHRQFVGIVGRPAYSDSFIAEIVGRFTSLEQLRDEVELDVGLKAFVLRERFRGQFEELKRLYIEIFPSVEDIDVDRETFDLGTKSVRPFQRLLFKLKEHEVPTWIREEDISSGMYRTLAYLIELFLAPVGTVVLIDEFENSLGVNCMGPLTEFIQTRATQLQFIITSHHPYIINKIPKSHWKVVRRKGSTVRVTPSVEIPALQGASAQDDFTRLINSPEFEEGSA